MDRPEQVQQYCDEVRWLLKDGHREIKTLPTDYNSTIVNWAQYGIAISIGYSEEYRALWDRIRADGLTVEVAAALVPDIAREFWEAKIRLYKGGK